MLFFRPRQGVFLSSASILRHAAQAGGLRPQRCPGHAPVVGDIPDIVRADFQDRRHAVLPVLTDSTVDRKRHIGRGTGVIGLEVAVDMLIKQLQRIRSGRDIERDDHLHRASSIVSLPRSVVHFESMRNLIGSPL